MIVHATDVKDNGAGGRIHCMLPWPNAKMAHACIW